MSIGIGSKFLLFRNGEFLGSYLLVTVSKHKAVLVNATTGVHWRGARNVQNNRALSSSELEQIAGISAGKDYHWRVTTLEKESFDLAFDGKIIPNILERDIEIIPAQYSTTDGKSFEKKEDAKEHQFNLNFKAWFHFERRSPEEILEWLKQHNEV